VNYYDDQSYSKDSLVYYFDTQWKAIYNFTPILTTLEEMKGTGNIGVISNIDLRRKILKTYNSYDVHIKNNEDIYKRLQEEFWKLILSEIPNIYPNEVNKILSYELDIETTLENFEIENRLKINHAMGMNTAIINLQDINNKLITELQRYL